MVSVFLYDNREPCFCLQDVDVDDEVQILQVYDVEDGDVIEISKERSLNMLSCYLSSCVTKIELLNASEIKSLRGNEYDQSVRGLRYRACDVRPVIRHTKLPRRIHLPNVMLPELARHCSNCSPFRYMSSSSYLLEDFLEYGGQVYERYGIYEQGNTLYRVCCPVPTTVIFHYYYEQDGGSLPLS